MTFAEKEMSIGALVIQSALLYERLADAARGTMPALSYAADVVASMRRAVLADLWRPKGNPKDDLPKAPAPFVEMEAVDATEENVGDLVDLAAKTDDAIAKVFEARPSSRVGVGTSRSKAWIANLAAVRREKNGRFCAACGCGVDASGECACGARAEFHPRDFC
ncbi:MAG: hypothetical protein K6F46_08085 [Desulfovibrio sp.]|nr:hypothetical protein [Desulfovibrio sp.]